MNIGKFYYRVKAWNVILIASRECGIFDFEFAEFEVQIRLMVVLEESILKLHFSSILKRNRTTRRAQDWVVNETDIAEHVQLALREGAKHGWIECLKVAKSGWITDIKMWAEKERKKATVYFI